VDSCTTGKGGCAAHSQQLRVKFRSLGAVGTVTGSKFLVETPRNRILVDCGLYQDIGQLRLRNWQLPPVAPDRLDAAILWHAHQDHSGYLPAGV
jgi:metallo-beta-lactamase family protein